MAERVYEAKKLETPLVYGVKHIDLTTRMESRSGGIFTALTDIVLDQQGVVYGCVLDENFVAVHKRAETKEERNAMRGSKYVQSNLGNVFREVKKDLEDNRLIVFSGTPCEVHALQAFLGKKPQDNILYVDIVCHGVPSPLVWKDYLRWVKKGRKGNVTGVEFRNKKKYGWKAAMESITIGDKTYDSNIYTKLFYSHLTLRPACHQCPYKSKKRSSDITIADFWGIETVNPEFNDDRGVSQVILSTTKGVHYFELVKENLEIIISSLADCKQSPYRKSYEVPEGREEFWKLYEKKSFSYIAKKYAGYTTKQWLRRYLPSFLSSKEEGV